MKVSATERLRLQGTIAGLRHARLPWWEHWREVADFVLPRRYVHLHTDNRSRVKSKNPFILDATATTSARTLASGMMNGITSPARPWFKLRIAGAGDSIDHAAKIYLDEVQRRMLLAMAETNFYNSMATMYLDLAIFGTSATLIYEDFESVFRCYNQPLGLYYLDHNDREIVDIFAREFTLKVRQLAEWFGEENLSQQTRLLLKEPAGAGSFTEISITHLIEPNRGRSPVPSRFAFRETYWETSLPEDRVLRQRGFNEMPGIFPRWEIIANDPYGSSPSMDALPDVIQLQHETKKKAQSLDKLVSPPVIADIQLQHRPTALLPNGVTYVAGVNTVGVKPIYTVQPPLNEMTLDIADIRARIREIYHNDLFKMISQLETVRSATEIDARREEKLILLGPVLERFENEALDPAIKRIFAIMGRAGLLPDPPPNLRGADIEIQYVSILSAAQSAVGVAPTERWLQLIGNLVGIAPSVVNIPDWEELVRDYGADIGVKAKLMRSREVVAQAAAAQAQQQQLQQMLETGEVAATTGKTLSETDVGGGANALQRLLSG